jgi:hypothetical protein
MQPAGSEVFGARAGDETPDFSGDGGYLSPSPSSLCPDSAASRSRNQNPRVTPHARSHPTVDIRFFVTRDTISRVLDEAPSISWRVLAGGS